MLYRFEIQKYGQIHVHISPIFSCQVTNFKLIMITYARIEITNDYNNELATYLSR